MYFSQTSLPYQGCCVQSRSIEALAGSEELMVEKNCLDTSPRIVGHQHISDHSVDVLPFIPHSISHLKILLGFIFLMYFLFFFCFNLKDLFSLTTQKNIYSSLQILPYVVGEQSQPELKIMGISNPK